MPTNPGVDNLLCWYSLDEASGSRADAHGQSDPGTLTDNNTVGSAEGKQGNAGLFVRANSEYLSATGSALLTGATAATWTYWHRTGTGGVVSTISSGWTGGTFAWLNYFYANPVNGYVRLFLNGTSLYGTYSWGGVSNVSEWHHVAIVFDGSGATNPDRLKMYINGVDSSLTFNGTIPASILTYSGQPFALGSFAYTPFNTAEGRIDEHAIFDKALSSDEVAYIYNSGTGIAYAGLSTGLAQPLSGPFGRALKGAL